MRCKTILIPWYWLTLMDIYWELLALGRHPIVATVKGKTCLLLKKGEESWPLDRYI